MAEQTDSLTERIRDVNARIRAFVERESLGKPFWIGGHIRNLYPSDRGHIYFELVDDDYSIYCMVREPVRGTLDFTPNNGMDIEAYGTIRVYEKRARLEFEVEQVRLVKRPILIPDLSVFEQLEKKGLYPRRKRDLPARIRSIGLVTSRHSDAERDFYEAYRTKGGSASIGTIDVRVHGQQAPREIADAISRLNHEGQVDVIALVRGGGRLAEIAVFDDLLIVEAICRSDIPVVTGIGHQPNLTLADRVADVSQITPTAAAHYLAEVSANAPAPLSEPTYFPADQPSARMQWRTAVVAVVILLALVVVVFLMTRG